MGHISMRALLPSRTHFGLRRIRPQSTQSELFEHEYQYWRTVLSSELSKRGVQMNASQLDPTLVPRVDEISLIQTEAKANPKLFLSSGMQATAYYLSDLTRAGATPQSFQRILEFGVGYGRILRHFQPFSFELHGCDVMPAVIDWCTRHLSPVGSFLVSGYDPPLPYPANFFDFVYANSVFTHLQHEQTKRWITELHRVVRKGGVVITTHYDINEHLRGFQPSTIHKAWSERGYLEWGNKSVRENNISYSPDMLYTVWSEHFEVVDRCQYPLEQSHLTCIKK